MAASIGIMGSIVLLFNIKEQNNIQKLVESPWIWVGRAIQGVSVGIYSVLCPIFIKELVPIELSVNLGVIHQLMMSIGALTVKIFSMYNVSNDYIWLLFSLPIPILLIQIIIMKTSFKYETAKYWLSVNEDEQARSFYNRLYNEGYAEELFLDLRTAARLESEDSSFLNLDYNIVSIKKKALAIGIYVAILQQLSGAGYVTMFGIYPDRCDETSEKYNDVEFEIFWTFLGCISTLMLVVTNARCCPLFIKKSNSRRVLLQVGTVASVVCIMLVVCLLPPFDDPHEHIRAIQVVVTFFVIFYGWTLGPTTWLYLSEILENEHISKAMAANWLMRFLIVSFFPQIGRDTSSNKQIMFSGLMVLLPLLLLAIYLNKKYVIETKNRHRIDIIRDIDAVRLPCNLFN